MVLHKMLLVSLSVKHPRNIWCKTNPCAPVTESKLCAEPRTPNLARPCSHRRQTHQGWTRTLFSVWYAFSNKTPQQNKTGRHAVFYVLFENAFKQNEATAHHPQQNKKQNTLRCTGPTLRKKCASKQKQDIYVCTDTAPHARYPTRIPFRPVSRPRVTGQRSGTCIPAPQNQQKTHRTYATALGVTVSTQSGHPPHTEIHPTHLPL